MRETFQWQLRLVTHHSNNAWNVHASGRPHPWIRRRRCPCPSALLASAAHRLKRKSVLSLFNRVIIFSSEKTLPYHGAHGHVYWHSCVSPSRKGVSLGTWWHSWRRSAPAMEAHSGWRTCTKDKKRISCRCIYLTANGIIIAFDYALSHNRTKLTSIGGSERKL